MSETPRRLQRSRSDRVIAGVAGGLAERYGWSVWTTRALFVFLTLATAAVGILAYVALMAFVPLEEAPAAPEGGTGAAPGGGVMRTLGTLNNGVAALKMTVAVVAGIVALPGEFRAILEKLQPAPPPVVAPAVRESSQMATTLVPPDRAPVTPAVTADPQPLATPAVAAPEPAAPPEDGAAALAGGLFRVLSDLAGAPEMDAALERELREVIRGASQAESRALLTLDPTPLYGFYSDELLAAQPASLAGLSEHGLADHNELLAQEFHSFDVGVDGSTAVVYLTETWSSRRLDAATGECLGRVPARDVPQTLFLERGDAGWRITSAVFDTTDEPQYQPC